MVEWLGTSESGKAIAENSMGGEVVRVERWRGRGRVGQRGRQGHGVEDEDMEPWLRAESLLEVGKGEEVAKPIV